MRKILFLVMLSLLISSFTKIYSQNNTPFTFYGFVRTEAYYDSRQILELREGLMLFYPLNEKIDAKGNDLNQTPSYNFTPIGTRVGVKVKGPKALGAETMGVVEAEFFGNSNATINTLRLRHSYLKLNWTKTELLMGQTWHPLFTEESIPSTLSFNTGSPFQPFNRSPQIRLTQKMGNFSFQFAAINQRDFASTGPAGVSVSYMTTAIMPEFTGGIIYKKQMCDSSLMLSLGVTGEYKMLRPRIATDSNVITNKTLSSSAVTAFIKLKSEKFEGKIKGTLGQNLYDQLMLGGYAIRYYGTEIPEAGDWDFTSLDVLSTWIDLGYKFNDKFSCGLFGGWSKNLGSTKNIQNWNSNTTYYSKGSDVAYLYRVAPRISYTIGKTQFAFEAEYTTAAYGNKRNSLGVLQNKSDEYPTAKITEVNNLRFLGVVVYNF